MTKKLVWRLGKLPSPDEVRELVKDKIITQEEAREILFSFGEEKDRDAESLKSEVKFLRELVEKLSQGNNSRVVEIIREVERPIYRQWPWFEPYFVWCGQTSGSITLTNASSGGQNWVTTDTTTGITPNFSDIKTF